jgi:membrane protease YdiL (CAAX protease family)
LKNYFKLGILPYLIAEGMLFSISFFDILLFELMVGLRLGFSQGMEVFKNPEGLTEIVNHALSQDAGYQLSTLTVAIWGLISFFWYRFETNGEVHSKAEAFLSGKNLVFFILLGLGGQGFFSGAIGLLMGSFPKFFESYTETIGSLIQGNLFVVVLYTVLIAPIAEELVFRGVILHKAGRVLPFIGANVLQAAFFGIYHQNIVQGIYAALLGFLFGLVCRKFNSLYASILLHILVNASAFLVMLFPESAMSSVILLIGGMGMAAVSIVFLKLWRYHDSRID